MTHVRLPPPSPTAFPSAPGTGSFFVPVRFSAATPHCADGAAGGPGFIFATPSSPDLGLAGVEYAHFSAVAPYVRLRRPRHARAQ